MDRYALLEDNVVVNVIICDESFLDKLPQRGVLSPMASIGDVYDPITENFHRKMILSDETVQHSNEEKWSNPSAPDITHDYTFVFHKDDTQLSLLP